MKIIALILLLLIILTLTVYNIKFNSDGYDILLRNRFTKLGFGIDYKGGLEIWHFAHTVHGGRAEKPLYPFAKCVFVDTKTYRVDLDNNGKKETIATEVKIDENTKSVSESTITVTSEDKKNKDSFSMPKRLTKTEFISLNKDGHKQIVARSHSGLHYTHFAIYGYKDGKLYKIFENGSACPIEVIDKVRPYTIKIGRENWDVPDWCYGSEDFLWEVWQWDGEKFVYNSKLSTAKLTTEQEAKNRYVQELEKTRQEIREFLYEDNADVFADLKAYYEDLDNDGNLETITAHQKYFTSDNMPPFAEEGIITVYDPDIKTAVHFSMPERMGEIEFASLNRDGFKQIIARSQSGMHYTNLAIYGYKDGRLYKIFEDGSACGIETDFNDSPPIIRVGRANWGAKVKTEEGEEINWSYASEPLWQVYRWDGKKFIYDEKLSTTPRISENEEANRFVDEAKKLMRKGD